MDYTSNNNTQRMRQSMGPVDQPNWNGGPRLNHNPQVMNTQVVGPPNLSNAISNQTRDIIDNDNANYRALHDEMVKMQMDAKDQTIASQQAAINKLELTASQCAQNQYLVNQLRPAAVPAFTVPNPYANYGFGCYCGSTNNGCC